MTRRFLMLLLASPAILPAQKYDGPKPPKPDIPYLKHADNLVETEVTQAKEENHKDDLIYVVSGAASSARTPLASPIFVFQSDKLEPEKLQLYKLEVKNGNRQVLFSHKKKQIAMPIRLEVTRLDSGNLYKLEVDDTLAAGEYSLTPDGTNQVFCFEVF
jgi:hypothetical protein